MITLINAPQGAVYLKKDLHVEFSSNMIKSHENDLLYIRYVLSWGAETFEGRIFYNEQYSAIKIHLYNFIFDKIKGLDLLPSLEGDKSILLDSFLVSVFEERETFVDQNSFRYSYNLEPFDSLQIPTFVVLPAFHTATIPISQASKHAISLFPQTSYKYVEGGQFFLTYLARSLDQQETINLSITYYYTDQSNEIEEEILTLQISDYQLYLLNIGTRFKEKINTAEIDSKKIIRAEIQLSDFDLITCFFKPSPRYEVYPIGYYHHDGSLQVLNTSGKAELILKVKEHVYSTLQNNFGADMTSKTQSIKLNSGILSKEEFFFFAQVLESQYLCIYFNDIWHKITRAKPEYKYLPNSSINSIDLELTISKTTY